MTVMITKKGGVFKSITYQFHNCKKFGNREIHFCQDGALGMDADTRKSEEVK
jgi:hypothetical protein